MDPDDERAQAHEERLLARENQEAYRARREADE
jgi:hypothetical protein